MEGFYDRQSARRCPAQDAKAYVSLVEWYDPVLTAYETSIRRYSRSRGHLRPASSHFRPHVKGVVDESYVSRKFAFMNHVRDGIAALITFGNIPQMRSPHRTNMVNEKMHCRRGSTSICRMQNIKPWDRSKKRRV